MLFDTVESPVSFVRIITEVSAPRSNAKPIPIPSGIVTGHAEIDHLGHFALRQIPALGRPALGEPSEERASKADR